MKKIDLLQRLLGAGIGFLSLAVVVIITSIIILFFNDAPYAYQPSHDDLIFLARNSSLSLLSWNVIGKICLIISLGFVLKSFWNMHTIIRELRKGFFEKKETTIPTQAAQFLFIGFVFMPITLNLLSLIDYLIAADGSWRVDGNYLIPLFILIAACLFIASTALILEKGMELKQENDLTV
jgi:hypothetical protein